MLELIFFVLMIVVFGKMIGFALRASWGIAKILLNVVLLPAILIGLVVMGLIYVAIPLLLLLGIFAFLRPRN